MRIVVLPCIAVWPRLRFLPSLDMFSKDDQGSWRRVNGTIDSQSMGCVLSSHEILGHLEGLLWSKDSVTKPDMQTSVSRGAQVGPRCHLAPFLIRSGVAESLVTVFTPTPNSCKKRHGGHSFLMFSGSGSFWGKCRGIWNLISLFTQISR